MFRFLLKYESVLIYNRPNGVVIENINAIRNSQRQQLPHNVYGRGDLLEESLRLKMAASDNGALQQVKENLEKQVKAPADTAFRVRNISGKVAGILGALST
ncbi:hypothetical protein Tco_0184588 [Tanacetum coccineum]